MKKFRDLIQKSSRFVRAHVALARRDMHVMGSEAWGDANAQTVCSCGWRSKSYGSGDFYTWEARWDMASAEAYRHLSNVGVVSKGKHYDAYRKQEFA